MFPTPKALKGLSFNFTQGNAQDLRGPMLTIYKDPDVAERYVAEIAIHSVMIRILKAETERPTRCYYHADPSGPSIKVELPDGLVAGYDAAHWHINTSAIVLRKAVESLGIPEHDFAAARERMQTRKAATP